jgi:hypothetical protein
VSEGALRQPRDTGGSGIQSFELIIKPPTARFFLLHYLLAVRILLADVNGFASLSVNAPALLGKRSVSCGFVFSLSGLVRCLLFGFLLSLLGVGCKFGFGLGLLGLSWFLCPSNFRLVGFLFGLSFKLSRFLFYRASRLLN